MKKYTKMNITGEVQVKVTAGDAGEGEHSGSPAHPERILSQQKGNNSWIVSCETKHMLVT